VCDEEETRESCVIGILRIEQSVRERSIDRETDRLRERD